MDRPFSQINSTIQKLPRSSGKLDAILIGRLVAAVILLAAGLYFGKLPLVKTILLILSVLVAGYDVLLELVDAVMDRQFFSMPLIIVLIAVLSFVIGSGWEGAVCVILYQVGRILVQYATDRTKAFSMDMLAKTDPDLRDRASIVIDGDRAGETVLSKEIGSAASLILKCLLALALLFAVLMPLLTSLSVREGIRRALIILAISLPVSVMASLPLTGIIGISFATRFGTLFNNALILEKTGRTKTVVIDKNGIFSDSLPSFLGIKSEILDENTFMEFVSHAVYYSDQAFAKAILAAQDREFRLDLISDFKDIPGTGVEVKIGGTPVSLTKSELIPEQGEDDPFDSLGENCVYYLMIAGKYIGKVLLSETINRQNSNLISDLKRAGVKKCILLTEDSKEESEHLGLSLNADEVFSEFTDQTKLQYLESLDRQDTMYIYANSLQMHSNAAVDVRVSKKGKYADALINPDELGLFPAAFHISQRVREVTAENAIFAFIIKAIVLFLGVTGNCTVWFAVFLEFIAALAAILNSVRVTKEPIFEIPKE